MSAERHSSWESEEVPLNALAAVNNLTYYATGDGLWSQQAERLGEGEWVGRSGRKVRVTVTGETIWLASVELASTHVSAISVVRYHIETTLSGEVLTK